MSRLSELGAGLLLVLALTGCRSAAADGFALDGSPRHPDDEGIVTSVDLESVTVDGRRYEVDDDLVSFSSLDLSTVPLLYTEGQYVQVGLRGDVVEWLGTIARPLATEPPRVLVAGEVESVDDRTIVFDDGLVLRLGAGVDAEVGAHVQVAIDPDAGVVTEVES